MLLVALLPVGSEAGTPGGKPPGAGPSPIEEIVVSADASFGVRLGSVGSGTYLDEDEIDALGATHISETLARVPGVWINRGSGQEHLTAIRSPVYTGLGACGEFLYLEDGIPIRPAGFCNINNLFEVNFEQAGAIEVWRGPASAVLGGNALRGALNFLTRIPSRDVIGVELGPYDHHRLSFEGATETGGHTLGVTATTTSTDGWRRSTGHDQQKASLVHATDVGRWSVRNTLALVQLDQETGGYVSGYEAYEDGTLRRSNPNPDSYRDAWAIRAASHWSSGALSISPYLRSSNMKFLQHYIPGEPWEENKQSSGGLLVDQTFELGVIELSIGGQAEYMRGNVKEYQESVLTDSSAFNNAVRPQGTHYDFEVESTLGAVHYDLTWAIGEQLRLIHSLRYEWLHFDYDNRSLDGNTRDDGTACGFGGCLYSRPADRDDTFTNVAGRLGLERLIGNDGRIYAVVATGFRPPQINELYRLQRGQTIADLDSERIVQLELGYRTALWSIAVFTDQADHFIFRDAGGLNVSNGKTRSKGIEVALEQTWGRHMLGLSTTWADHRYDFTGGATGGEFIEDGNQIDSAPHWLTNVRWRYVLAPGIESEFELDVQGEYYLNADNTAEYPGHEVLNWRGSYQLDARTDLFVRVMNVLDGKYADRADFTSFGGDGYRYFPAMPRQFYVGVTRAL